MATQIETGSRVSQPLVTITEMDHIVLRVRDVEESLRFYSEVLGPGSGAGGAVAGRRSTLPVGAG